MGCAVLVMTRAVGIISPEIIDGFIDKEFVSTGLCLYGIDVTGERQVCFEEIGGVVLETSKELANKCDVLITCLPSADAFQSVMTGSDGIKHSGNMNLTVMDTSVVAIAEKQAAYAALARVGITLLDGSAVSMDTPVDSGLSLYVSGDEEKYKRCEDILDAISTSHYFVGEFGNGSKLKIVADHQIHMQNVATAEAMVLGLKAGLDPEMIYTIVKAGVGDSRAFELRAGMMVVDDYSKGTINMESWEKHMNVIADFAKELHCPIPLFKAGLELYKAGMDNGQDSLDFASVCRVLERMADVQRDPKVSGTFLGNNRGFVRA